jgi:hypothetical protein
VRRINQRGKVWTGAATHREKHSSSSVVAVQRCSSARLVSLRVQRATPSGRAAPRPAREEEQAMVTPGGRGKTRDGWQRLTGDEEGSVRGTNGHLGGGLNRAHPMVATDV